MKIDYWIGFWCIGGEVCCVVGVVGVCVVCGGWIWEYWVCVCCVVVCVDD